MEKLEGEVADLLDRFHGKRISINEVEWKNGRVIEALPLPPGLEALNSAPVSVVHDGAFAQGRIPGYSVYYKYGCEYSNTTKWTCLYENKNFNGLQISQAGPGNGRMLRFQDSGYLQDLAQWNFRDQASSWVNTTSNTVLVGNIRPGGSCSETGADLLWTEAPDTAMGYVGNAANDQADCIGIVDPR